MIFFMLMYVSIKCFPQTVNGNVLDEKQSPVMGVTIIIQKPDSTCSQVTITDKNGCFYFSDAPKHYRIITKHLSFECKTLEDSVGFKTIILHEKTKKLNEVIVKAPLRQLFINKNGALQYDANVLSKNHPAINALELIEGIPVVQKTGTEYNLTGVSSTCIMINGRTGNLSQEQIKSMLSSISPDGVKSIEVFYNTPAKYGIKGASININLNADKSERPHLSGSLIYGNTLRHSVSYNGSTYLMLTSKNISASFGYSLFQAKKENVLDLMTHHTIGNELFNISQQTRTSSKRINHEVYIDFNWKLTNLSNLSVFYSGNLDKPIINSAAFTSMSGNDIMSKNKEDSHNNLHNLSISYDFKNLKIGSDFSFYNQKEKQGLYSSNNIDLNGLYKQNYFKTKAYLNDEKDFGFGTIEYGFEYSYSNTDNSKLMSNTTAAGSFASVQKEKSLSIYVDFNKRFGKKGFIDLSVQGEYFKSTLDSVQTHKKTVLWNTFSVYPRLTFMYKLGKISTMQLTLSTQRMYPPYWVTASNRTAINYYCFNDGNPMLKPYIRYSLNLNYILQSKYIFGAFYEYCDDYYTQFLLLNGKELAAIYKYYNMERSNRVGLMAVLPIKWKNKFNTCFTGILFSMSQKGNVDNISFERNKMSSRLSLTNTLNLIKDKIILELSGWYQFPVIQGFYNVEAMYSVSMGMTWKTPIRGLSFIIKGDDILNTYRMRIKTDINNQRYSFENNVDQRYFSISVKYNFNGYTTKDKKRVIDERIGF